MATPTPAPAAPATNPLSLLPRCRTPRDADQLHAHLLTTGLLRDPSATAHVVLSLCSSPHAPLRHLARRVSSAASCPPPRAGPGDPFLWNALIKSSSHGADPGRALLTFSHMLSQGFSPDRFSFSLALKACSRTASFEEGSQLHAMLTKFGLHSDLYLQNSLMRFYCRCGSIKRARRLFDRMPLRDSISWNLIIDGYSKNGIMQLAQEVFDMMVEGDRNSVSWNSMICGYARLRSADGIDAARHLFDRMPVWDSFSWNSMIDGYVKCGRLEDAAALFEQMPEKDTLAWANMILGHMEAGNVELARAMFDDMPEKDLITWNIMLSGYVKNGCFLEALGLYHEMHTRDNLVPDATTLATVISAVAELGQIADGISVHDYIERNQLSLSGKLGVALIDMYARCGQLEKSLHIFEISGQKSVDHWNAMIGALAVHGFGHLALQLFEEMERFSLRPDDITFIEILSACSHAGLVKEGLTYFETMKTDYNVMPKLQHYGCVVDILGRDGQLEEARRMIEGMPMEPNDVVWRSLLSACRNHGNLEIGEHVAKRLIEMSSADSSSFVLLSNIYAGVGMWGNASKVRMMMKEQGIRKVPGCSWIELDGSFHDFFVGYLFPY
ncbi:hypothetical protein Taro_028737 [Colocasia esculenta]|uniref:Chlororespiratory reduction 4 n=1 Tax=Colocasia esculenta TaxID=4460 RepID=A0A843VV20_COLES|nr:hypothetical protein [Colocasia esculenta]